jgi:hypothetical protein
MVRTSNFEEYGLLIVYLTGWIFESVTQNHQAGHNWNQLYRFLSAPPSLVSTWPYPSHDVSHHDKLQLAREHPNPTLPFLPSHEEENLNVDPNNPGLFNHLHSSATFANSDVPHQVLPSLSTPPLLPGQEHLYGRSRSRRFSNQQRPTEENAAHHQPERLGIDPHCTCAGFDSNHLISGERTGLADCF